MSHRSSPGFRIEPPPRRARRAAFDITPALDALTAVGRDLAQAQAETARIRLDRAEQELGIRTGGLAPRADVLQSLLALRQARTQLAQGRVDRAAAEIDRAIAALTGA
jgi:predicted negative regulator of RcsB-dependent stress response